MHADAPSVKGSGSIGFSTALLYQMSVSKVLSFERQWIGSYLIVIRRTCFPPIVPALRDGGCEDRSLRGYTAGAALCWIHLSLGQWIQRSKAEKYRLNSIKIILA